MLHDFQVNLSIDCLTTGNKRMMTGALPIKKASFMFQFAIIAKGTGDGFTLLHALDD
jgi:hypothetical protein